MSTKRYPNIILASASPRRLEIMKAHGIDPMVIPADCDETVPEYCDVRSVPADIASRKAHAVLDILSRDESFAVPDNSVIVAADTIVYQGPIPGHGEIMGKPRDFSQGWDMLTKLRNTHHAVITGVCMIFTATGEERVFYDLTRVWFKDYTDEELKCYLLTDEAYDKAGAYAVQGTFGKYTERLEGDYENVIGLPWYRIEEELSK
ncbi:MAG: septum formation protein Maf [Firmicutes bacterium]|nr:septum formation protein Maf [Bacillota bacterium]